MTRSMSPTENRSTETKTEMPLLLLQALRKEDKDEVGERFSSCKAAILTTVRQLPITY